MKGSTLSILIWPVISRVINLLIAEHWSVLLLVWWRALVTLSIPIGFPVKEDTTAGRWLASHPINATWTGWPVKYHFFAGVCCVSPKWLFSLLSNNWSNVWVCVWLVLPSLHWNCLVSPSQLTDWLWNEQIELDQLKCLFCGVFNQT